MVGDSEIDMEAAARAGCRSLLVQRGTFLRGENSSGAGANVVSDLLEAVDLILRRETPTLEETLRHDWQRLRSPWLACSPVLTPSKRNPA